MSVQWALQQALYAALANDATLAGRVTGIYSGRAPQGTAAPYIVVGEKTERDSSTHSTLGAESTAAIHIWSEYRGEREVLELYDELRRVLHYRPLAIAGHSYQGGTLELVTTSADPDGETMHGVARYRIRTEEQ